MLLPSGFLSEWRLPACLVFLSFVRCSGTNPCRAARTDGWSCCSETGPWHSWEVVAVMTWHRLRWISWDGFARDYPTKSRSPRRQMLMAGRWARKRGSVVVTRAILAGACSDQLGWAKSLRRTGGARTDRITCWGGTAAMHTAVLLVAVEPVDELPQCGVQRCSSHLVAWSEFPVAAFLCSWAFSRAFLFVCVCFLSSSSPFLSFFLLFLRFFVFRFPFAPCSGLAFCVCGGAGACIQHVVAAECVAVDCPRGAYRTPTIL